MTRSLAGRSPHSSPYSAFFSPGPSVGQENGGEPPGSSLRGGLRRQGLLGRAAPVPDEGTGRGAAGDRGPARLPRRAGRRRAAAAQPGRDRLRRGRPALRRRVPRVQPAGPAREEGPATRPRTGCIRLLEDTDGDGVYDKSTLFAADVPMATSVACWDGGVYVGSPPDLLYLKDTDGDGKADVRRVVFTGFGRDPAGEGMLNSFRWGLDNRFHISTEQRRRIGPPRRSRRGEDGLGPRLRAPPRPARRDLRADRRRRPARDDAGRLGPDLRLRQQRPVPPGDVRQPLPRPQPVPAGARRGGERRPGGQVHQAATASARSSRGGPCGRGCGPRGSSRARTRGARRRASSPARPG